MDTPKHTSSASVTSHNNRTKSHSGSDQEERTAITKKPFSLSLPPSKMRTCHLFPSSHSHSALHLHSKTLPTKTRFQFRTSAMAKRVLVPIAVGSEPVEAVVPIDVLRRAGADVTVASVMSDRSVAISRGVKLIADVLIRDCAGSSFDLIALPGGVIGGENLKNCAELESLVKKHVSNGGLYAGICAGAAVALASWGLLNGLKATSHPILMEKFPSEVKKTEDRVVVDGKAITSRGPGTSMEFAVTLVEQLFDKQKAQEVSGPMVMRPKYGVEHTMKEFNSVEWKSNGPPQVLVAIANGTEEMEAVYIIDTLRIAEAKVIVVSVENELEILASRKVKIVADMLLDEAVNLDFDFIALPGGLGGADAFSKSEKLISLIKKQADAGKPYGAICASPALALEPHGLLKGKKATCYPAMWDKLSDKTEFENRVIVDGNLITSQGPGTSMEFALSIVEKFYGRDKALDIAKYMAFI